MMQKILDAIPHAETITSRTNPLVISLAKLSLAKHRAEQSLFLAEGIKLSEETAGLAQVRFVLLRSDDGFAEERFLSVARRAPSSARVLVMPQQVFDKITTENAPQGIITVLSPLADVHRHVSAPYTETASLDGCRVLAVDSVQDPGNLGTIIRTAAAFGYTKVVLGGCADIYHPKTVRASMGTLFRMQIDVSDALAAYLVVLKERGHRVLSAALGEHSLVLGKDTLRADDCVVIGNEGHGVSQEILSLSDAVVRIPMAPGTESLNAAGAASVLMWEYFKSFT